MCQEAYLCSKMKAYKFIPKFKQFHLFNPNCFSAAEGIPSQWVDSAPPLASLYRVFIIIYYYTSRVLIYKSKIKTNKIR